MTVTTARGDTVRRHICCFFKTPKTCQHIRCCQHIGGFCQTYRGVRGFQNVFGLFVKIFSYIEADFAFWFLKTAIKTNWQKIQITNSKKNTNYLIWRKKLSDYVVKIFKSGQNTLKIRKSKAWNFQIFLLRPSWRITFLGTF